LYSNYGMIVAKRWE